VDVAIQRSNAWY